MTDPTNTTPEPEEEIPAAGKAKRLTEAEWVQAKVDYELGKATKQQLADEYGITRQAIGKGLAARGAVYGSKSQVVEEAAIAAQKDEQVKRVEDIAAMKEKQRKMVEMVQNLTIKAITDQVRGTGSGSKPIGDVHKDIATLNKAMATIALGRNELYHIYDLHRDPDGAGETEEFIVSEYSQDEIDALNKERLGIDPDDALAEAVQAIEEPVDDALADLLGE